MKRLFQSTLWILGVFALGLVAGYFAFADIRSAKSAPAKKVALRPGAAPVAKSTVLKAWNAHSALGEIFAKTTITRADCSGLTFNSGTSDSGGSFLVDTLILN